MLVFLPKTQADPRRAGFTAESQRPPRLRTHPAGGFVVWGSLPPVFPFLGSAPRQPQGGHCWATSPPPVSDREGEGRASPGERPRPQDPAHASARLAAAARAHGERDATEGIPARKKHVETVSKPTGEEPPKKPVEGNRDCRGGGFR